MLFRLIVFVLLAITFAGGGSANEIKQGGSGERVVGKWRSMKITTNSCKARGYTGGRVKVKGAWYCWKPDEARTLRPQRIGSKRQDVITVTDGPVSCTGGPCSLIVDRRVSVCTDIYVEVVNRFSSRQAVKYKNEVALTSARIVRPSSEQKKRVLRMCQTDTVSVECSARKGEIISLNHITHKHYFKSKIRVKGVRFKQRRVGRKKSGSSKINWTSHEYKIKKRKTADVVGMFEMWLPVSQSTQCDQEWDGYMKNNKQQKVKRK